MNIVITLYAFVIDVVCVEKLWMRLAGTKELCMLDKNDVWHSLGMLVSSYAHIKWLNDKDFNIKYIFTLWFGL